MTNAGLKNLAGHKNLARIFWSREKIDAATLEPEIGLLHALYPATTDSRGMFRPCKSEDEVWALDLTFTKVDDAALKELAVLKNLEWLSLGATNVTDAGLQDLVALKKLCYVELLETKVTENGIAELRIPTRQKCAIRSRFQRKMTRIVPGTFGRVAGSAGCWPGERTACVLIQ